MWVMKTKIIKELDGEKLKPLMLCLETQLLNGWVIIVALEHFKFQST